MIRRVSTGAEGSYYYHTNNAFHRITAMKSAISLAILGALARYATAFPAAMMAAANQDPKIMARTKEITAMIEARQAGAGAASGEFTSSTTVSTVCRCVCR